MYHVQIQRVLKRPRSGWLSADQLKSVQEAYNAFGDARARMDRELQRPPASSLRSSDLAASSHVVFAGKHTRARAHTHTHVHTHAHTHTYTHIRTDALRVFKPKKRSYQTVSSIKKHAPWERGYCVVEFKDTADNIAYGIIASIVAHKPYAHVRCPEYYLFKVIVLKCERGEYLDRVCVPKNVMHAEGDLFILFEQVQHSTICLMPAYGPSELTKNFTHNPIHIP